MIITSGVQGSFVFENTLPENFKSEIIIFDCIFKKNKRDNFEGIDQIGSPTKGNKMNMNCG